MANIIPSDYPSPTHADIGPGKPIIGESVSPLFLASNYIESLNLQVVSQGWSGQICQNDAVLPAMPAAGSVGASTCLWRIPEVSGRSTVVCRVRCIRNGATGKVRFRDIESGNVVDVNAPASLGWVTSAALTVDSSAGYADIEAYIVGTGVGLSDTVVYEVAVDYPPLTTLAVTPDGFIPIDEDEIGSDQALSSDLVRTIKTNISTHLDRPRMYWSWSGLRNVSSTLGAGTLAMPRWPHTRLIPVHRGTVAQDLTLTVWALARNNTGADQYVRIRAGGTAPDASTGSVTAYIEVPSGTASYTWFQGEIRLPEDAGFTGVPYAFVPVTIWPSDPSAVQVAGQTDAQLGSISIWGV